LVLRTAGINCDGETVRALELAGARVSLVHLQRVLDEPARLDDLSLLVIPGGFSYGDDVSAGRVFGLELRHSLATQLTAFVERGGFVLGVCNGFQVLVEAGLFEPGPFQPGMATRNIALANNASNRFECRWGAIEGQACAAPWVDPGLVLPVPVAHGEGRFVVRDEATLQRLVDNRQIAWRYVLPGGQPAAGYPANPNGSLMAIAGICDPTGRVLGLMPHPERNLTPWNHPHWTRLSPRDEGEGVRFYRRLVEAASGALV
jgi:phosphoribosylformylglycinamidine synthase